MQINKVQNGITFGYNQQLNDKLVKSLTQKKKNKEFYNILLEQNRIINCMEDALRNAEKIGNNRLIKKLKYVFADTKSWFCTIIDDSFPNLDYAEQEFYSYKEEMESKKITNPDNWLRKLVAIINGDFLFDSDEQLVKEGIQSDYYGISDEQAKELGIDLAKISKLTPEQQEKPDTQTTKKPAKKTFAEGKKYLHEYIPTEAEKKGFASLGGMTELKETLNDRVVDFLKDPEQAKIDAVEYGKQMPKGILLYGPPGCGKTTIIERLSTEAGVPLFKMEMGSMGSQYIHKTSENIDAAFNYLEDIAKTKPVIAFIDDGDTVLSSRDKTDSDSHAEEIGTFLNRIQKASENNIMVFIATNKYDLIDSAVKSRFEEQIFVPLPDFEARKELIRMFMNSRTKGQILANNDEDLSRLAQKTERFSIRSLKMMADKASLIALKDGRRDIMPEDFEKIIAQSENVREKNSKYLSKSEVKPMGYSK